MITRRRAHRGQSTVARDYFNRANGAIGAGWTATSDGALTISSSQVIGTAGSNVRGEIRTGETYASDHYSQIEVTSTAIPSGGWIGPSVRTQNSGQNCYVVIYFNNSGAYSLLLYKRVSGTFTQIDPDNGNGPPGYTLDSPLATGDQLRLSIAGSQITVLINSRRVTLVTDTTITSGGNPGIIADGAATADNWAGDNIKPEPAAPYQTFTSSPPNSANNGGGHHVAVLTPTPSALPASPPAHNFLYILTVDPDGFSVFGDGIDHMYGLGAHHQYNLTIIEPTFGIAPWYVDHASDSTRQLETFMVTDLVPWVTSNYTITGTEQHWLIGFSRSGFGGATLLFRHPTIFKKGAFWDWPFDMNSSNYVSYGADANLGTSANLTTNYQMTSTYLDTYKTPFQSTLRIWINGYQTFQTDITDADTQLTAKSMLHTNATAVLRQHRWESGWVPDALAALAAMP